MPTLRDRAAVELMRWPRAYKWARRMFILVRFAARRPHDADFAAFARSPSIGLFLDVGANAGMSALSFRIYNRRMPILSVEANPHHEPELRFLKRWLRAFDYRIVAAGEAAGTLRLHVPLFRGVPLTGEASVLEDRRQDLTWWARKHLGRGDAGTFEFEDVAVPAVRLDDLNLDPSIVKIDVEGFELSVLRGLEHTISRCRPVLLLEAPADIDAVSSYLAKWGYHPHLFDSATRTLAPYDRTSTNVFFVTTDGPAADFLATPRTG